MPKHKANGTKTLDLGVKHAGIASFVFIAKAISLIVGGVMLIVITRLLGPAQYGIYTLSLAISGFIVGFGSLNISAYFNKNIPKLIAKGEEREIGIIVGDSLLFLLFLSLMLIFIGAVLAGFIAETVFGSVSYIEYVYLALSTVLWYIIYSTFTSVLVSFGIAREVGIASVCGLIFQSVLSIILVSLGFGAVGAILGYTASLLIGSAIVLYYINAHVPIRFTLGGIRNRLHEMIMFSIPLTVTAIITSLTANFVVIFFGILLISTSAIGEYGIAARVGQVFDAVSGAISVVLIPMFATAVYNKHSISKISKLYHDSVYYNLLFTTPLIVYASVLSKDIILTLFTSAYTLAIIYMPLVSIGMLISFLWNAAYYMTISIGRVDKVLRFAIICTAIQLVSMLILGELFGVIGVIIAYFYIGNIAFAFFYFRGLRNFGMHIKLGPILKLIISNLIFGAALVPLVFLQIRPLYVLIIGVVLGLILYPIALIKMGALSKNELDVLYQVSNGMPFIGGIFRVLLQYSEFFL
jgi:O-antigen/teichoic acid export membrane protein